MSDSREQTSTPASRETGQNKTKAAASTTAGAVAGGAIGAALGPIGAAVGAAMGGAAGNAAQDESAEDGGSAVSGRGPSDERFADPATDADWRTSDGGLTSVGASDQNADTAAVPSDQPGVRSGDADTPAARSALQRERSHIAGDETAEETGRAEGELTNANFESAPEKSGPHDNSVPTPTSPTSSSSTTSLPEK